MVREDIGMDNLRAGVAFTTALAVMASKYMPELRTGDLVYIARPPTLSFRCEGKLCEEFVYVLHQLLESDYDVTIEIKGNRYTFHIHKKLSL